ncbi:discoidin domain-containing protein [Kutzneria sp. CA-103260]|uniref:discoidin domain-containing protein n=1 Tax=Kutzneria sp. CA-103260 TaxID=2802641 RepID=UPI001BAC2E5E|nr:discoidin domain-containing protein [Kutzneria sp. CA-103260]QUQ72282.1 carbohydrate-binding protein [Kutzneria sp. CA-103260]
MSRRRLATSVATAVLVVLSALATLFSSAAADAATTDQTFLTFYGWWDNTPPGGDISYPQIHDTAGGSGSYSDPITFATDSGELKPGTKVWVPRVRKYFIMEDSCEECSADWNGKGPNGGPKLRHLDLWLGGKGGNAMDAIDCEDALTHYNADNTPTMEPVVVDPPSNEDYDSTPIFNTSTGACYGGAKPNQTVGSYKNNSTGLCLDDPNNSSSSGTTLKTAACNGSAEQTFTFHGAFLIINNQCATISGSSVKLGKCDGGPNSQLSINPDGTINDIQTGKKCFRDSSGTLTAASCSGTQSKWTFSPAGPAGLSVAVNPASATVKAGASTTATVAVTGGTGTVALSATGVPAGVTVTFDPASVSGSGNSTMTVAASDTAKSGTFTVVGAAGSDSKSATFALTVGTGGSSSLLSQGKTATASSVESSTYAASKAFDGNLTSTRWGSKEGSDPQWLQVDLGTVHSVTEVKLTWEAAYGKSYTIQTSTDGSTWSTVYSTTTGNGGTDDLTGLAGSGRYVRMNGTARGTSYGYSLYEMQVYGS